MHSRAGEEGVLNEIDRNINNVWELEGWLRVALIEHEATTASLYYGGLHSVDVACARPTLVLIPQSLYSQTSFIRTA